MTCTMFPSSLCTLWKVAPPSTAAHEVCPGLVMTSNPCLPFSLIILHSTQGPHQTQVHCSTMAVYNHISYCTFTFLRVPLSSLFANTLACKPTEPGEAVLTTPSIAIVLQYQENLSHHHTFCSFRLFMFFLLHRISPLGRFDLVVAMSVCQDICLSVCPLPIHLITCVEP